MRMNSPRDFSRVFKKAKRLSRSGLTFLWIENSYDHPRLGLAVAKKHLKLASSRNRVKRIIRTSFQQHLSEMQNIDIVVLTRSDIKQRTAKQLNETLDWYWHRVIQQ